QALAGRLGVRLVDHVEWLVEGQGADLAAVEHKDYAQAVAVRLDVGDQDAHVLAVFFVAEQHAAFGGARAHRRRVLCRGLAWLASAAPIGPSLTNMLITCAVRGAVTSGCRGRPPGS